MYTRSSVVCYPTLSNPKARRQYQTPGSTNDHEETNINTKSMFSYQADEIQFLVHNVLLLQQRLVVACTIINYLKTKNTILSLCWRLCVLAASLPSVTRPRNTLCLAHAQVASTYSGLDKRDWLKCLTDRLFDQPRALLGLN